MVLNLMIIKLSSMIFILVLQNCPIRTNDLFDTVFWLAVFIEYKYKLVLKRFMTINKNYTEYNTRKFENVYLYHIVSLILYILLICEFGVNNI